MLDDYYYTYNDRTYIDVDRLIADFGFCLDVDDDGFEINDYIVYD